MARLLLPLTMPVYFLPAHPVLSFPHPSPPYLTVCTTCTLYLFFFYCDQERAFISLGVVQGLQFSGPGLPRPRRFTNRSWENVYPHLDCMPTSWVRCQYSGPQLLVMSVSLFLESWREFRPLLLSWTFYLILWFPFRSFGSRSLYTSFKFIRSNHLQNILSHF